MVAEISEPLGQPLYYTKQYQFTTDTTGPYRCVMRACPSSRAKQFIVRDPRNNVSFCHARAEPCLFCRPVAPL